MVDPIILHRKNFPSIFLIYLYILIFCAGVVAGVVAVPIAPRRYIRPIFRTIPASNIVAPYLWIKYSIAECTRISGADRPDRNGIVDRFQGTEVEVGFAVVRLLELQMHYLLCFHNPILVQIYRFSGVLPRFRARIDQSIGPTADIRKLAAFSFFFFRGTFFFFKG